MDATTPDSRPDDLRDRRAVEHVLGRPLDVAWPAGALAVGTRVRVVQDEAWAGPWQQEFLGTVSPTGAPEPVRSTSARDGELAYWVAFDEPQRDSDGDGPYRKALVWGRYLREVEG